MNRGCRPLCHFSRRLAVSCDQRLAEHSHGQSRLSSMVKLRLSELHPGSPENSDWRPETQVPALTLSDWLRLGDGYPLTASGI